MIERVAGWNPLVVGLEADLFFAVRISDVVRAEGGRPLLVDAGPDLSSAVELWPDLVLISLATPGWEEAVRDSRTRRHLQQMPIVAYGSHVEPDALRTARKAGCDHAYARSRFAAELPELVHQALHPPPRVLDGSDEPPPTLWVEGIEHFNAGRYWECHESLETLWRAEARPIREVYQGVLQVGVGFYHFRAGNLRGALKALRRGLARLYKLPQTVHGARLFDLERSCRAVHEELVQLGSERVGEFPLASLPRVGWVDPR